MERKCFNCKNYGCLVNQGYWWCELQKDMEHPETCDGWDEVPRSTIDTYASTEDIEYVELD